MSAPRPAPSSADVALEVANISAGLGIITIPLLPFALPALVLVLVPLVPLAIVGGLVALPFILPLWLLRTVRRGRRRRGDATGPPGRRSRRRPTLDLRDPLNELVHEAKPLPAIVATTPPIETNAAATSPATGALRHGPKTTAAAAVSRMIGPEGIVGKSSPEKYWIMIPAAATARPAALSLAAGDSCA